MLWLDDIALSQRRLGVFVTAVALLLAAWFPASAFGDEIFAAVGDYGSSGEGPTAVVQQAAQGVADQLNGQTPSFVLSLGDQLYGPFPVPGSPYAEFEPLQTTGTPSFTTAVGDLYGQYIKGSGSSSVMNFFPVLGDHDWWHETIQVDVSTGTSVGTAGQGYNTGVNITNNAAFYGAAQTAFANAQTYLSGANTSPSNTQFYLTQTDNLTNSSTHPYTIFGSPNTTANGDSYESYFSALDGISHTTSSAPIRWYDTVQGTVHAYALSNDPNELYQGGLNSINIQDPSTSADNLANNPQGQWFTTALTNSTATWNIVEMHQPVATASAPEEGYTSGSGTRSGHLSTAYMQWFDNTNVDLVIAGHVHGYERLYNNGITYINNGVGGTFESFAVFCNQSGAADTCADTYQVAPAFGGSSGTTWSNNQMLALTQMQVGRTYGYQLLMTSDANNSLESQFWGSTDPGNANGGGPNWTLLDDFFILKNGRLTASQAKSATGLELKLPNGASSGFGMIDTSGTTSVTLAALINGAGQLVVDGGGTLILTRPNAPTSAPSANESEGYSFVPESAVNTYSGGTYVTGGSTLQIANDGLLGASSGGLTLDAGTLKASQGFSSARAIVLGSGNGTFDTNGNRVTLSGQITGSGALTKTGADKLILSGNSTYTGPTTINQGTLSVNGSIVSDVTVNPGGELGGTGTVGSIAVASGGIYAPATPSAPRR